MSPPLLDHAGLTCRDLDSSLRFYCELLGMPLLERGEGVGAAAGIPGAKLAFAFLDAGEGRVLELLEYRDPHTAGTAPRVEAAGATHVALRVADLDGLLERLATAGFRPLTAEPVTVAGDGASTGTRLVYVPDPDGRVVELVQPASGEEAS
ncbi:VOC family protein [Conexibacter woesei]|uniref:Glyoxalase/bleomycin resistance protein/dioxygenase n=1 Tax=Conexibacter woesei (strain DSM 14684 / CCUG 47730 / CIP 108061 / JCM 11494 / NBRC 100937 / ID131577) TaxID=469383 RepID=D3F5D8_CONWI|nr:VOC family protein [Conexibacter woesei]ADB50605.1 Glyoxalase/bleomycin resistance protein/dioxygenase [Conexibacter woesei DSM 14684]